MPRIEILPTNWLASAAHRRGDGAPTVDVCRRCADDFDEGHPTPANINHLFPYGGSVGSTEVEHPPFEDEVYKCQACETPLTEEDN